MRIRSNNKIQYRVALMFVVAALIIGTVPARAVSDLSDGSIPANPDRVGNQTIFLPVAYSNAERGISGVRVNAPYFSGDVRFSETAVFWFGQVSPDINYADVRIGYNDKELFVNLNIIDRRLWYSRQPTPDDLINWDAVSLLINLDGNVGNSTGSHTFQFVGGAFSSAPGHDNDSNYRAAYLGNGNNWVRIQAPYNAIVGWRGDTGFNVPYDQKGWNIGYHIPYSSLGLSGRPADGASWGIGIILHDRDDASTSSISSESWPNNLMNTTPSTWGLLYFGTPTYIAPSIPVENSITIREGLNGAHVMDGEVGGGTTCGGALDYWTQWGNQTQPGSPNNTDFNIQNQSDIADWPCYAKYYITFPLEQVPAGRVILSARLILHEMGSSGGTNWNPPPKSSYINVYQLGQDWDETTLTWNNAPQAVENMTGAWVDPTQFPGWPGIPFVWDVSRAVAEAYAQGQPLRLAMYSADGEYHSGKYFVSSHSGDWNAVGRPTLEITWGSR